MEDAVEVVLAVRIHDIVRGELRRRIHAHVERRILHVRKSPLRRIELMRRHAEIEQHAIDGRRLHAPENLVQMAEIVMHDVDAARKTRKPPARRRDGLLVLIDADEPPLRRKE